MKLKVFYVASICFALTFITIFSESCRIMESRVTICDVGFNDGYAKDTVELFDSISFRIRPLTGGQYCSNN
ncbi:MAG: hypothetical protein ABL940_07790, partial [Bacteroidia bacterium]